MKQRIVVGVSGASGMPLAVEVLNQLRRQPDVETHLVLSRAAEITLREESSLTAQQLRGWRMSATTTGILARHRPAAVSARRG